MFGTMYSRRMRVRKHGSESFEQPHGGVDRHLFAILEPMPPSFEIVRVFDLPRHLEYILKGICFQVHSYADSVAAQRRRDCPIRASPRLGSRSYPFRVRTGRLLALRVVSDQKPAPHDPVRAPRLLPSRDVIAFTPSPAASPGVGSTTPACLPRTGDRSLSNAARALSPETRGTARCGAHHSGDRSRWRTVGVQRPIPLQAAPRGVRQEIPLCAPGLQYRGAAIATRRGGRPNAPPRVERHARSAHRPTSSN